MKKLICANDYHSNERKIIGPHRDQANSSILEIDMNELRDCILDFKQKEILIVDDNVFNLVTLEAILKLQFGFEVEKASNGQEAVDKVK